jgi:hypothetical protein
MVDRLGEKTLPDQSTPDFHNFGKGEGFADVD